MKKLSIVLSMILLVVGLGSCDKKQPTPEPTKLTLNSTAITLKVGETEQLKATVEPTDQTFTVTFSSDNEAVATVDAMGLVKAVAEGTAKVTAQVGKLTQICVVTVSNTAPTVKLEVKTPTLSIEKGKTAKIDYMVTPADTPVTFSSDKTEIATVDNQGVVTAVAVGSASITLMAAGEQAVVAVTVTDNGGGGTQTTGNELPLLKFDPTYDENTEALNDPKILEHESKLGRTAMPISISKDLTFDGFVNRDLTITGAIYGLQFTSTKEDVILAFSKESLSDCPKTTAMLAEYGFTNLKDMKFQDGTPFKEGVNSNDPTMSIQLYDSPNSAIQSVLAITLIKARPKEDLPTAHDLLPSVMDFPDYATFATGDAAKIKEYETTLGLREYNSGDSDEAKKNLAFDTPENKLDQTNFTWVYYISTPSDGPKFINSQINFLKNEEAVTDPKIKEWFAANGYTKDYTADAASGYIEAFDATGKTLCLLSVNRAYNVALLQFVDAASMQSADQVRRLGFKNFKMMYNRPAIAKGLQQNRR